MDGFAGPTHDPYKEPALATACGDPERVKRVDVATEALSNGAIRAMKDAT